jgi:cell division GTPase FtsZ
MQRKGNAMSNDFDIDIPSNPDPEPSKSVNETLKQTEAEESNAVDLPDIDIDLQPEAPAYVVPPDAKKLAVKFGIIGSGQAGARLCDTFFQIGYRRTCVINTTSQDFLGLKIPKERQLVLKSTDVGAGKNPAKGREALNASTEEVLNLMRHSFGEDIERIIITAGMGGGSGTGSAIGLYKLAKYYLQNLGKKPKVGMVVTLPKKTEGGKVQGNAYKIMEDLKILAESKALSPFIVVDNESIHKMFPNVSAKQFWTTANRNTVGLFDIFNVLACQPSEYVTFDSADYKTVLDSGVIVFGATKLDTYSKDTDISDGLRTNLKRTLLADVDITEASHVAAILCAPDKLLGILPQSHIDLAFATLERIMAGENRDLMVHQGVYEAKKMGLYLYTIVGGLSISEDRLQLMKARAGLYSDRVDEEEN